MGTYDDRDVSKALSHALRHAPERYDLALDDNGWAPVEAVVEALRRVRRWPALTADDVAHVVATNSKNRFELSDGRVRARYGHSIPERIALERRRPPAELFHGTTRDTAELILTAGLLPMSRQYVHMSIDTETAQTVGARKGSDVVILTVAAARAADAGVAFYLGNDATWLADSVPPEFLTATG